MEPELTDENLKNLILKLPGSYKFATKHFVQFLKANNLTISYKGITAYLHYLKNPGSNYRPNTFNLYLAAVKNRMNFLLRLTLSFFDEHEKFRIKELLRNTKYDKINKEKKIKTLSITEIKKLVKNAPTWLSYMIRFLFMTGVCVSEMLKIRYIDMKQDKTYSYISIKGNKKREIQIETPFIYTIAKYFNGNTYLFENNNNNEPFSRQMVSMSIKRLGRRVLSKEISAHTLRHTFASILIHKTGKIMAVSEYLGHKSINTTVDMYVNQVLSNTDLNSVRI